MWSSSAEIFRLRLADTTRRTYCGHLTVSHKLLDRLQSELGSHLGSVTFLRSDFFARDRAAFTSE